MARPKKAKPEVAEGALLDVLQQKHGVETVLSLGDAPAREYEVISTGSFGLDAALGIGGMPRGRIVELIGPESSGKTTLALHLIASAQAKGLQAFMIDAEHALDVEYARALGVQVDKLLLSQPDYGEQALDMADTAIRSGQVGIVVIDSVAALTPKAELEGEMGDSHVGLQARMMSQALRKLTAIAHKTNTLLVFINQIRMKIGVMFGSPETTTGGNALKFYASVRLDIRRIGQLKSGEDRVGARTRVKVIKNKVSPPFRECEFDIAYGRGISVEGELVEHGVAAGVVEKSGAWISFNGERLGQGLENTKEALRAKPDMVEAIRATLVQKLVCSP